MSSRAAWLRRPSSAVSRLGEKKLLLLSARDLLRAAVAERRLLVAFVAPVPAAMNGFVRAAREARAPLLLVRPSGLGGAEPSEARDDSLFVQAALKAAERLSFAQPMALLKDPPRASQALEHERVRAEIEAGFTGVSLAARVDEAAAARDAALSAAEACRLDLGLEVVPLGGSAEHALEMARALSARGSPPSALRITGHEREASRLSAGFHELALTSANERDPAQLAACGLSQLTASGPFLRALHAAAPPALWEQLQSWADAHQASLEESCAHHARELRALPAEAQETLEAISFFEAAELLARARAQDSGGAIAASIGRMVEPEAAEA